MYKVLIVKTLHFTAYSTTPVTQRRRMGRRARGLVHPRTRAGGGARRLAVRSADEPDGGRGRNEAKRNGVPRACLPSLPLHVMLCLKKDQRIGRNVPKSLAYKHRNTGLSPSDHSAPPRRSPGGSVLPLRWCSAPPGVVPRCSKIPVPFRRKR